MTRRHVFALAVLLALLLGVRLLTSRSPKLAQDLHGAGVVAVVEQPVAAESVKWIRVTAPAAADAEAAKPPEPLELLRAGDAWTVTSAHGAPAHAEAVEDFVEAVTLLSGEMRGRGEKVFADFGVEDGKALRVELGSAAGTPSMTLLVGKQGDAPTSHFVRVGGDDRVFHVRKELRRLLGAWGDAPPSPDHWVDKTIVGVKADDVAEIVVERPDMRWVLREVAGVAATLEPELAEAPQGAWTIAEPSLPWTAPSERVSGAVERAAAVSSVAVIDPALPACATTGPAEGGRVTFTLASGDSVTAIVAGKVERAGGGADEVAVRVEGKPSCHALARWSVDTLMPQASALLDVPQPWGDSVPLSDVTRITSTGRSGNWAVRRAGEDEWTFEQGGAGSADSPRVSQAGGALVGLRLDDLAREELLSAEAKQAAATLTAHAGTRRLSLQVLGQRMGGGGQRYVRFEGPGAPPAGLLGVISASTAKSLLPELAELRSN